MSGLVKRVVNFLIFEWKQKEQKGQRRQKSFFAFFALFALFASIANSFDAAQGQTPTESDQETFGLFRFFSLFRNPLASLAD